MSKNTPFISIDQALVDFKKGKFLLVVDDENRENEGDLIVAAEKITFEQLGFMIRYTSGVICVPLDGKRLDELQIPMMHYSLDPYFQTPFTLSVDAANGTSGISASSRLETIKRLINPSVRPNDFVMPGHIFPLRAHPDGVFGRTGHTEAAVDLAKLAKLTPAAVIGELVDKRGEVARLPQLVAFAKKHAIGLITIQNVISYRKKHMKDRDHKQIAKKVLVQNKAQLPTPYGMFTIHTVEKGGTTHLVLTYGDQVFDQNTMVRVHSSCTTSEIFGSLRCDCKEQLHKAMEMISQNGSGILIYLYQEGRGIGLKNKIKAYALQDSGMDTVSANKHLGFGADIRDYIIAAEILKSLKVKKVSLLTNNPDKIAQLESHGITIVKRIPLTIKPGEYNKKYLQTKKNKLGHLL